MIKHLVIACCVLSMTACASNTLTPMSPNPNNCGLASATLVDEKALYATETAYNIAANAYVVSDSKHLLSVNTKASVKSQLLYAYKALKLARAAYAIGDKCGFLAQANAVATFTDQAKAFLPAKGN